MSIPLRQGSSPVSQWRIELFGGLRVLNNADPQARPVERFRSQRTGALLAYLARYQRQHTREHLADMFWPESSPEKARDSLRTALAALRAILELEGAPNGSVLVASRTHAGLNSTAIVTDLEEFQEAIAAASAAPDDALARPALERAVNIYGGPLLHGLFDSWLDSWLTPEASYLGEVYINALKRLVGILETSGELTPALDYLRRGAAVEPFREDLQLEIIRLTPRGDEIGTLQHFDKWLAMLKRAQTRPHQRTLDAAEDLRRRARKPLPRQSSPAAEPVAPSVTPSFPSADRPTVRLPASWNSFVGREEDVERLLGWIRGGEHPLITILGPGGGGKTRLALEVAREFRREGPEGKAGTAEVLPIFVSLAEVTAGQSLFRPVLDALGFPRSEPGLRETTVALEAARPVADSRLLLVLDNFERIVSTAAPQVRELLEAVPSLTCLVTSRNPLRLAGEQEYPLPPLAVPKEHELAAETAAGSPSVRLFFDRARKLRPDLAYTRANLEAVARLCVTLGGLPLAIEIAAARSKLVSPAQLLAELDTAANRRREMLDWQSGSDEAPRHHASLRKAIDWSARQLPTAAGRFWSRLAIFRGGWTLEQAEIICDEANAGVLMSALRDASLISMDSGDRTPGGEPRGYMLEALREYAGEQLSGDDAGSLRERHAEYFLTFVERARTQLASSETGRWLRRLDVERENINSALEWLIGHDVPGAMRAISALAWPWELLGRLGEGGTWASRTIAACRGAFPGLEDQLNDYDARRLVTLKASTLNGAGKLFIMSGGVQQGTEYLEEALRLFRIVGDAGGEADSLYALGTARGRAGNLDEAARLCQASVDINRTRGDDLALADSLYNQSLIALSAGDYAKVRELNQERLGIHARFGYSRGMALSLDTLGMAALFEGDAKTSRAYFTEAKKIFESVKDWPSVARCLWGLGHIARGEGRLEDAREAFDRAMRLTVETHTRWGFPYMLESFAYLAADQGQSERAVRLLAAAGTFRETHREPIQGPGAAILSNTLETLKAELGVLFDVYWTLGSAMTTAAATEFALEPPDGASGD